MFEVIIEYIDGEVEDRFVTKEYWFEKLYEMLENDETVLQYGVQTVSWEEA